jgi:hypothetical protein
VVTPAAPTVPWANPAGIVSGAPLSSAPLDATADVPGTFTDSPAAGTVLGVGNNQTLSMTFTPTDAVDYTSASDRTSINVLAGTATATATYLRQDATTQGTWMGTYYGSQGSDVIDGPSSLPGYASVTPSGQANTVWASPTTDPRALQTAGGSSRVAACW